MCTANKFDEQTKTLAFAAYAPHYKKKRKKAKINGKPPHQAWVHSCSSYFSDNGSHDPCTPPPPYPPRRCAASCPCHPLCHRLPPADAPAPLSLRSPCPPHDEWSASPTMSEPPAAAGESLPSFRYAEQVAGSDRAIGGLNVHRGKELVATLECDIFLWSFVFDQDSELEIWTSFYCLYIWMPPRVCLTSVFAPKMENHKFIRDLYKGNDKSTLVILSMVRMQCNQQQTSDFYFYLLFDWILNSGDGFF